MYIISQFEYYACRQRIDILRYTVSRDNGFRIVTHELLDCFFNRHNRFS